MMSVLASLHDKADRGDDSRSTPASKILLIINLGISFLKTISENHSIKIFMHRKKLQK